MQPANSNRIFSRLALKIIAVISLSVLVIQLLFITYIENSIYESELQSVVDQQKRFTEANAIYIAELMSEDNEDSLYLILSSLVGNPLIESASIEYTDDRGSLQVGEPTARIRYDFDISDLNDNDELVSIGTLSTFATTAFIEESRSTRILGLLLLAGIVFFVVLALSVFSVQRFVGIPLQRIMQAIGRQDRVPDIQWKSHDEMGAVVERLNFLHGKLNEQVSGLEQELIVNERLEATRIRSLANASLEGIFIFDGAEIIDLNNPMAQLMGGERAAFVEKSVSDVLPPDVITFLNQPMSATERPTMSTVLTNDDGVEIPVEIHLGRLEDHNDGRRVAVVRDMSEHVAAEQAMWRLAHYDSLTGLPNRRYFSEILDQAVTTAHNEHALLSVAYLDLDNFKFINDSRGHSVGDDLLRAVAASLKDFSDEVACSARLGGDEFALLMTGVGTIGELDELLQRIMSGITDGEHCQPWKSIFSVSIGVATLNDDTIDIRELLTRADLALYKAKNSGRARVCFYSDHIDVKLKRERLIVEKLVHAIERDELALYYQPQILCDGSAITGFEALLRWDDSDLGTVSPAEIVAIAEREGMVSQLGRWVLSKACRDANQWPDHIRLAVNLSPLELVDESLPDFIQQCLNDTGFPASRLEIEITETALVSDSGMAEALISRLKEMGIMIALDDFGTGYSSLSMLQKFPFDRIKIDRSFVSNLSDDSNKASIVASIIDLGLRLDLDVIAEGVESERDRQTLQQFNCKEFQGYLVSRPIAIEKVPAIIDRYEPDESQQPREQPETVVQLESWKRVS